MGLNEQVDKKKLTTHINLRIEERQARDNPKGTVRYGICLSNCVKYEVIHCSQEERKPRNRINLCTQTHKREHVYACLLCMGRESYVVWRDGMDNTVSLWAYISTNYNNKDSS